MKQRIRQGTRFWTFALVVGCLAGVAQAESLIPLQGGVAGGVVESGGRAALLVDGGERRASTLVLIDDRGIQGKIDLPPRRVGRTLTVLTDGRILLESQDATTMYDRVQHYDIVEIRGDRLETSWSWSSRDAFPGVETGNHGFPVVISGDGRAWGAGGGASFSFGATGTSVLTVRNERFEAGQELSDLRKWEDFLPHFVYLDSAGPVILAPWNKGAYIVHFAESGSPLVMPALFDNGAEEYDFLWQWEERVLWAESSLYWKGYELPDLGLSGVDEEPVWVLDKSSGAPHPERGVVQVSSREGAYRVEHAWRDPVTGVEERRASAWHSDYHSEDAAGRQRRIAPSASPWSNDVFVSADGRHAAVVEEGRSRGVATVHARALTLHPAPPEPPLKADRDAEARADGERLGRVEW